MTQAAGRIAGGLVLLVTIWITAYWLWGGSSPPVRFAQGDDAIRGVKPQDLPVTPPPVAPAPREPDRNPAPPPPPVQQPQPALPPPTPMPEPKVEPAPRQAVVPPEFIQHTVAKGETFELIAKKYYGVAGKGSIIAKANPMTDPTRLMPGRVVMVPKNPANIQGVPAPRDEPEPGVAIDEYTVQEGDTLSQIAQEVYGESRLWTLIRDANRDRLSSESSLKIGQRLRIPAKPQAKPEQ
jgi:nucleoid-associated protein YgaU